jgi:PPM family protein phosphatase
MRVTWAAATDPGVRRPVNEDAYCARPDIGLFVVADGMGGHAAGEVASRLAVESIEAYVASRADDPGATRMTNDAGSDTDTGLSSGPALLQAAFMAANQRLATAMQRDGGLRGMATTASALRVEDGRDPSIAHIGDSRIYLLRGGRLARITEDHSWVEEQVRAGVLDAKAARQHPWRSVVTRALNGGDDPRVDAFAFPLHPGDRVLVCSDGLSSVLSDDRIAALLGADADLSLVCRHLIEQANAEGGPDNITTVVVEVHAA